MIGDGPEEQALRQGFDRCVPPDRIEFAGRLSNDETLERFAGADALILTSTFEGLPVAMLEAMGHGLVPVVTRIDSGVGDIIRNGENGFAVPIGDIDGFAAAFGQLADPARRAALRQAAFDTIAEGPYSIDHAVRRYLEIIEGAVAAVSEGRFIRPKPIRPGSWTEDYLVPPELQIAPDEYYDLKFKSDWQAERIRALEAQLYGRTSEGPIPLWKRIWRVFYRLGRRVLG